MKRIVLVLAVFGMVFAFGTSVHSAEVPSTLDVTATVLEVCTVSTTPINFPDYDGWSVEASGSIDVTCTNTLPYNIALDAGGPLYVDGNRQLSDGVGNYIIYTIKKDSEAGDLWGDSDFDSTYSQGTSYADLGNGTVQTHIAHGRIFGGQYDAPSGLYTAVVNVTVYY